MGSSTAAGSALAISAGVPATQDAAGYAALTYTEIGQIEKIGAIGSAFAKVEFQPLKGAKQKHKGSVDYGSLAPSLAHDEADAGQTLLRTAAEAQTALYAFKVTYPDGAKRYFQGRVFGYPENTEGADSIIMATPTIEINTPIVKVAAS
jgi:hypothetical protein